jgi:hypothetical protein
MRSPDVDAESRIRHRMLSSARPQPAGTGSPRKPRPVGRCPPQPGSTATEILRGSSTVTADQPSARRPRRLRFTDDDQPHDHAVRVTMRGELTHSTAEALHREMTQAAREHSVSRDLAVVLCHRAQLVRAHVRRSRRACRTCPRRSGAGRARLPVVPDLSVGAGAAAPRGRGVHRLAGCGSAERRSKPRAGRNTSSSSSDGAGLPGPVLRTRCPVPIRRHPWFRPHRFATCCAACDDARHRRQRAMNAAVRC